MVCESEVRPRLADRLRTARERGFVGRRHELAVFEAALGGTSDARPVLFFHGPGGIGKSALLRRFADLAGDTGRPVALVDGHAVDSSPDGFAAEAGIARDDDRAVLLVDNFEKCQGLEGWLRDRFLPQIRTGAVVVLAGREPPGIGWTADPGWKEILYAAALSDLAHDEAAALLDARGVPVHLRETVAAFAGGRPLALSLAAAVATKEGADSTDWRPAQDVMAALVAALVGDVPGAAHRTALEVCSHVLRTTQGLLRAVLGEEDAGSVFQWLRRQPYMEVGRRGVFPHGVVRGVLDADLRWRDPEGHQRMHDLVWPHLLEAARTAPDSEVLATMRELSFPALKKVAGRYYPRSLRHEGRVHEDVARPEEHSVLRTMTEATEGPESAELLDFWLARQPESVRAYRDSETGELVGFLMWLRLHDLGAEELARDPVAAFAWEHARRTMPLRHREHIGLNRFLVDPSAYHQVSETMQIMQLRIAAEWVRTDGLAWSYEVLANPGYWRPLMDHVQHHVVPGEVRVGGRPYTVFAHDWRAQPVEQWLRGTYVARSALGAVPAVLPREQFDAAVREALRDWRRPDRFAASPLTSSRLARDAPDRAGAAEAVRAACAGAAEQLRADPGGDKHYRAVAATFFAGAPTQQAAAGRLGVPFSTYRRHLAAGLRRICDLLWEREIAA